MSAKDSFMGPSACAIQRVPGDKLSAWSEANNGTGGQRHTFFAGKPCSFNTIGGVTGTQRAFESRTKEQGVMEWQNHLICKACPAESSAHETGTP